MNSFLFFNNIQSMEVVCVKPKINLPKRQKKQAKQKKQNKY